MATKRVAPRKSVVAKAAAGMDETSPGDVIELSLTVEVTDKRGRKQWAKAGLSSSHRPGESTEDAVERVQSFVIESVNALQEEMRG